MSIFKKRPLFPTNIFVVASISTLITLPILIVLFHSLLEDTTGITISPVSEEKSQIVPTKDPLISIVSKGQDAINAPIISKDDPSLGPDNARVTIVEYSDYKCQYCQKQESILKKVLSEYKDKVRLIWKDYPERDTYSSAWMTNIAARCAGAQGQFWAYHDLLFKDNKNFGKAKALDFASRLKLDKSKFSACLDDTAVIKQIQSNIKEANALNISGVPLIYVNAYDFLGEVTLDDLRNIINSELKK